MSNLLNKMGNIKTNIPNANKGKFSGRGDLDGKLDFDGLETLKRSEQFLEKLRRSNFDLGEMENLIKKDGNQLIIAIAGSGKTTTLLCKIQYNILTGELSKMMEVNGSIMPVMSNVLVCTFLKSGAEELRKKLLELQESLGLQKTVHMIKFSTLHSEFYQSLRELGYSLTIISEKENTSLLRRVVKANNILFNGKTINSTKLQDLETALYFTRSRLDDKRYSSDIYLECGIGPREVDNLIEGWRKLRVLSGKIDFSDLEEILYNACYIEQNESVINHLADKYDFIYIDEFQDTSQIQYKLLKIMAINTKKVVAVGDDDQTIYSWRGSDINIITKEFVSDFDAEVSKLTYNFRCPSNVLKAVVPSITKNVNRVDKDLKAFREGGTTKIKWYRTLSEASSYLQEVTYNSLKENKTVAIICRTNMDGLIPALTFENNGRFAFSISSKSMTLDNYIGRLILRIGKLFYSHSEDVIKPVLNSISWEDSYSIDSMARFCSENKLTVFETKDEDIKYSLQDIGGIIIHWKRILQEEGEMSAFFNILDYFKNTVFKKDNSFNNNCREVIDAVIFYAEANDCNRVRDVIEGLYNLNISLTSRVGQNNTRVKVVTAHEFKGKEADVVVIWNDSEGVFPPSINVSTEDFEEERRVHYIACTRAIDELHIIAKNGRPSVFLKEMDLSIGEVV